MTHEDKSLDDFEKAARALFGESVFNWRRSYRASIEARKRVREEEAE